MRGEEGREAGGGAGCCGEALRWVGGDEAREGEAHAGGAACDEPDCVGREGVGGLGRVGHCEDHTRGEGKNGLVAPETYVVLWDWALLV